MGEPKAELPEPPELPELLVGDAERPEVSAITGSVRARPLVNR